MIDAADYLETVIDPRKLPLIVDKLARLIQKSGVEYDTIVCRGMSGALVAPTLAWLLDKGLTIVRKGEQTHSFRKVEGYTEEGARYIVVDDLICSGDTMASIHEACEQRFFGKMVHIFLYLESSNYGREQWNSVPVSCFHSTFQLYDDMANQ